MADLPMMAEWIDYAAGVRCPGWQPRGSSTRLRGVERESRQFPAPYDCALKVAGHLDHAFPLDHLERGDLAHVPSSHRGGEAVIDLQVEADATVDPHTATFVRGAKLPHGGACGGCEGCPPEA